jgi:hypothetical protein
MREDIKTGQAEIRSIVGAFQEKFDACVASRRDDQKETISFQETAEAHLECKEQTSVTMESEEKHQEAPKEDAVVKPVKGRKKRHRGRKPAAGRRGEPKELAQSDCGSGKKLAEAGRKMTRHATEAWRKRNVFRKIRTEENCGPCKEFAVSGIRMTQCAKVAQGRKHGLQKQEKDDIAPRTRKGQTEEKRRFTGPDCKNGIRNRGLSQQLHGNTRIKDPRL